MPAPITCRYPFTFPSNRIDARSPVAPGFLTLLLTTACEILERTARLVCAEYQCVSGAAVSRVHCWCFRPVRHGFTITSSVLR